MFCSTLSIKFNPTFIYQNYWFHSLFSSQIWMLLSAVWFSFSHRIFFTIQQFWWAINWLSTSFDSFIFCFALRWVSNLIRHLFIKVIDFTLCFHHRFGRFGQQFDFLRRIWFFVVIHKFWCAINWLSTSFDST